MQPALEAACLDNLDQIWDSGPVETPFDQSLLCKTVPDSQLYARVWITRFEEGRLGLDWGSVDQFGLDTLSLPESPGRPKKCLKFISSEQ